MTFADWLKSKKGILSTNDLSLKTGIDENTINKLLSSEIMPNTKDIITFWIAFKLDNKGLIELISVVSDTLETSFSSVFNDLVTELVRLTEEDITLKRNKNL